MKKFSYTRIISILILLIVFSINPVIPQDRAISKIPEARRTSLYLNNHSADALKESYRSSYSETRKVKNSENYFKIDRTGNSLWNGKHWKQEDFPLKVFVKGSDSEYFKRRYFEYVDYAFLLWSSADQRISFVYVDNPSSADVKILFEENLMEKYDENYLGITDYELNNKTITQSIVEISLLKFGDEVISSGEIKNTIIHEIGHALGLGHSENDTDIMYPFINPFSSNKLNYDELSEGDIKAVSSVINLGNKIKYSTK